MNQRINEVVGKLVNGVTQRGKAILAIPSDEKDTVNFTVDETSRVYVHSQGIRITAKATKNNLSLGGKKLESNKDLCKWQLKFNEVHKATEIIANLD